MEIIQVSATSLTSTVAQAIESVIHEYHCAEVQAIGPEAAQRAEQALSLATGHLQHDGLGVACAPQHKTVIVDNRHVTLTRLMVNVTAISSPSPHFFPASSNPPINTKDLPRV
jgi:stage V sporulation protein SpoVS